jgi:hypothetical protein
VGLLPEAAVGEALRRKAVLRISVGLGAPGAARTMGQAGEGEASDSFGAGSAGRRWAVAPAGLLHEVGPHGHLHGRADPCHVVLFSS